MVWGMLPERSQEQQFALAKWNDERGTCRRSFLDQLELLTQGILLALREGIAAFGFDGDELTRTISGLEHHRVLVDFHDLEGGLPIETFL